MSPLASLDVERSPVRGGVRFVPEAAVELLRDPQTADVAVICSACWDQRTRRLARALRARGIPFVLVTAGPGPQRRRLRGRGLPQGSRRPAEPASLLDARARRTSRDADRIDLANGLAVDLRRGTVVRDRRLQRLTSMECSILRVLLEAAQSRPPRYLRTRQISQAVRGFGRHCAPGTVRVHIHNLRGKIESVPEAPAVLVSRRGLGYRLLLATARAAPAPLPGLGRPRGANSTVV